MGPFKNTAKKTSRMDDSQQDTKAGLWKSFSSRFFKETTDLESNEHNITNPTTAVPQRSLCCCHGDKESCPKQSGVNVAAPENKEMTRDDSPHTVTHDFPNISFAFPQPTIVKLDLSKVQREMMKAEASLKRNFADHSDDRVETMKQIYQMEIDSTEDSKNSQLLRNSKVHSKMINALTNDGNWEELKKTANAVISERQTEIEENKNRISRRTGNHVPAVMM